jgi:hypothetical protein
MSFSSEEQDMFRTGVDRHFADLAEEGFQISPGCRDSPLTREQLVVE